MASPYAFVTLLTSDHYLPGALALAAALRDVHPSPAVSPEVDFQTVCLVTPEIVDVSTIKLLRRAFDVVIGVEVIAQEDEKGLHLLGRPDLNAVLTKLHIFRLTQYSKIIFLDADVLPIKPLSHLFTTPHEFSAVPDVGWPDIFNSGVLVLSPGKEKFSELQELLKAKGSWDGGDQGILNEWRGDNWNRLSFTYNTTPTAAYTYAPAYERFGSQISAIHFIGPNKPWKSIAYRAPFVSQHSSQQPESSQRAYNYESLVDKWFDVYDKHYRSQAIIPETEFEMQKYMSAWDEQSGTGAEFMVSSANAPATSSLSLEDLRRLAIEGINSVGRSPDNRSGEGEYRSMPLEGRVDLMRPPPPPKEPEPEQQLLHDLSVIHRLHATQVPVEVPPSPHPHPISLPRTSSSTGGYDQHQPPHQEQPQFRYQTSSPDSQVEHPRPQPQYSQARDYQQHHDKEHQLPYDHEHPNQSQFQSQYPEHHHHQQPQAQPQQKQWEGNQQQQQYIHTEPPRPPSPPKLLWNPAVEPPPNTLPTPSAFPSDTYFPNVWDQPPSKHHDQTHQHTQQIGSPNFDSGAFFQPPPTPQIPESLRRQGHYRNVTGESEDGSAENVIPDRSKVKPVFPWEEKPRPMPGRVFPSGEMPSPALFASPVAAEVATIPSPEPVKEVKEASPPTKTLALPTPTKGLPVNLSYANAWDTVPSIQRYASRLIRPAPPQPLAAAFDDDDYRRSKSWEDRAEVSSRDGDDEDNADDDDGSPVVSRWTDDSDNETSPSTVSSNKTRSRKGSTVSVSHSIKGKKKEYRVRGVQTIPRELRDQAVQVDPPKVSPTSPQSHDKKDDGQDTMRTRKSSLSLQIGGHKKQWTPSTTSNVLPPVVSAGQNSPPSTAQRAKDSAGTSTGAGAGNGLSSPRVMSPDLRSPREFELPEETKMIRTPIRSASAATVTSPPLRPSVQVVRRSSGLPNFNLDSPASSRQVSNDGSSLASPPSSLGPASPPEDRPMGVMGIVSPPRKVGRVFDPARGVELFKRGSEEVLARFLKMSSWEEVSPQQ